MFKATPGVKQPRTLRGTAEGKNAAAGFDGPSEANYNSAAGAPREVAKDVYECNVHGTMTQSPTPSKSVKSPIK